MKNKAFYVIEIVVNNNTLFLASYESKNRIVNTPKGVEFTPNIDNAEKYFDVAEAENQHRLLGRNGRVVEHQYFTDFSISYEFSTLCPYNMNEGRGTFDVNSQGCRECRYFLGKNKYDKYILCAKQSNEKL